MYFFWIQEVKRRTFLLKIKYTVFVKQFYYMRVAREIDTFPVVPNALKTKRN